jgi:hypothetical protein
MIYTFLNKDTNEIEEHVMRLSEYDQFKENNPHLERHITFDSIPGLGDSMRMSVPGVGQPDARFEREIIGRIKKNVHGNTVRDGHKTKMPREW